jgi:alpha-tubulin suppressor-like RCC1 family protein
MKSLSIIFFTIALIVIVTLNVSTLISQSKTSTTTLDSTPVTPSSSTTSTSTTTPRVHPSETTTISLKAYGKNDHGQTTGGLLTKDQTIQKDFTIKLPGELKDIEAGKSHTLALTNNGYVYTWGLNDVGQLGRETTANYDATPGIVDELSDIVDISTTNNHNLALSKSGTVYAWGYNYTGQLGDGTRTNHQTPAEVKGLPKIVAIAAAHKFSLALTENGDVYAWGGSCDATNKQKALAILEKIGGQLTSLSGGYYDGGATGETTYDPTQDCLNEDAVNIKSPTPIKLPVSNVTAMSAGYGHALFLLSDGTVVGMGCNTFGQVGRTPGVQKGELVTIDGLSNIVQISAGGRHSLFLDKEGNVYATGANAAGQMGDRRHDDRSAVAMVKELPKVKKIFAGYDYSLAIAQDGTVWMWGANQNEFFIKGLPLRIDFPMQILDTTPQLIATGGAHVIFEF